MPSPVDLLRQNKSLIGFVAASLLAVISIAMLVYQLTRHEEVVDVPPPPTPPSSSASAAAGLSPEALGFAINKARIAIGHLENEKFAAADELLTELAGKLPDEPLVIRDLAICRLMTLESTTGNIAPERVQEALANLAKVEPGAAVGEWLAARANWKWYEKNQAQEAGRSYRDSALRHAREAARLEPKNAAFWYQLYEFSKDAEEDAIREEGVKALNTAFQLAPGNVRLALDWLVARVAAKDPAVAKALPDLRKMLEPMAAGVKRRTNTNILDFLDRLATSIDQQQWGPARGAATAVRNFLISEELTRSDGRQILRNPLEYVIYEFRDEVRRLLPAVQATPGVPVTFTVAWTKTLAGPVHDARSADFNLDGKLDLIVLTEGLVEVYSLQPSGELGASLVQQTVPAGMRGLLVADLDRDTIATAGTAKAREKQGGQFSFFDADPDVIVFGDNGAQALRNDLADDGEHRSLVVVPQEPAWDQVKKILTGVLVDADHDGDLDAVFSVDGQLQIWSNRDNVTFEAATQWSQLPPGDQRIESLAVVDWDRDVDVDLLVGGATLATSGYLENLRHGQLRWRPFGPEFATLGSARELLVWDGDGNGSWDVLAAGDKGLHAVLTTTIPAQGVAPLRAIELDTQAIAQLRRFDFDNDGCSDFLVSQGGNWSLWRGAPDGKAQRVPNVVPAEGASASTTSRIGDVADLDGDGDLDLLLQSGAELRAYRNEGGNRNHWLTVRIRGEAEDRSGRVNHFGIGSLLELKDGARYQAQVVDRQFVHFGLGPTPSAEVLRVLFTNGIPQSVVQPVADQLISEKLVNKGSCPFLYAWNGERVAFVTDLLWNAPLGLQLADGVVAKDRPWEYLLVRGDQLAPQGGHYELRITEELWEAGYFDQVELIAVDHPVEVEVYSNEKVGPPEIAEPGVHTVKQRHVPQKATDGRGTDWLPALANRDAQFAVPFARTFRKGRAEDHYLELDLGTFSSPPQRIQLFLTGWLQPGDTSLSVAASHNPELSPGQPPRVLVPDAQGNWQTAIPFMGFPGGKPKTIAVDLTGVFRGGDYRLRIATNFELYWDEVFFTVDEPPVEVRRTTLPLASADLHFRGFSAMTPYDGSRPESFDYGNCRTESQWPPMQGRFTRYGPVRDLLTATDRKLVVMSAGDEMVLRFGQIESPPTGWNRDFLLHNVGWDKDADLNTLVGQTVEPLPFVGMPSYPYDFEFVEAAERVPAPRPPDFEQYLREYQTRVESPGRFWRQLFSGGP